MTTSQLKLNTKEPIKDATIPKDSWRVVLIMCAASMGYFVVQLDVSIVNLSLPALQAYYEIDVAMLQWIVNAYTLVFSVLLLSSGILGDRYGSKRFLIIGYSIFFAGSLACGLAPNISFLLGSRCIQGIGAAIIVPNSLAVINWSFSGQQALRLTMLSIWMAFGGIGLTSGPIVGGIITSFATWQYIFFINLPVCLLGIFLTARFVQAPPKAAFRKNDWAGQFFLFVSSASLLLLIINYTDLSLILVGVLCAAAVAGFIFFIRIEKRISEPAIPIDLFADRSLQRALIVGVAVNFLYFGIVFYASLYFRDAFKMNAFQAGLAFIPVTLPLIAANILSGKLSRDRSPGYSIVIGLCVLISGALLLALPSMLREYWLMLPALTLISFGVGLITPMITATALQTIGPEQGGMISGVINFARQIAGAFGVAVFGLVVVHDDVVAFISLKYFSISLIATSIVLLFCARAFYAAVYQKPR